MGIEICGPSGEAVNNLPMFINDGGSSSASVRPAGKTSGIFGASYSAVISTEQCVLFKLSHRNIYHWYKNKDGCK